MGKKKMPRDIRFQKTQPPAAGPIGITQSPGTLTLLANQAGNATVATLAEIGGTGVSKVFSVTGNANLTVTGNALKTVGSPSFSAGVNQTYKLHLTDTGGTFNDPSNRTLIVPAGPTGILATPSTIDTSATLGTLAANLTDTGGTAPFTWTIAVAPDNFSGYLDITTPGATSTLTLNASGVGHLVAGTPLTGKVTVTDAGGNPFTSSTISVAVNNAATAPTGVNTTPSSITISATQTGGATLATMAEVGGSGSGVTFSVLGNANLTVSGSNLNTVASPSFTAGVDQTYFLSVTDSAGTYTDSVARTLTVRGAPTGVNTNPGTVQALANATAGTVLAVLSEIGGTGSSVVFSVSGNTNLDISGSNLVVKSGATFSAGVNQTFSLGVTDTGGSYSDSVPRTLTVPAGPTGVTPTSASFFDNAALGTIVINTDPVGGTAPFTFAIASGFNNGTGVLLDIHDDGTLTINATGVTYYAAHPGAGSLSGTINCTDAAGLTIAVAPTISLTVLDHSAAVKVTSFAIKNTSASTQTTPFVTKMFGHAFKKGDMLVGGLNTYPTFKVGATTVPYSVGAETTWSDGSLKFASFMMRIPTGNNIAGNGTLTVDVYNGGTKPSNSSRSLADFATGGHVYQVEMDGAAGTLSGTWIASLNDGVATGIVNKWMDGDAGAVWKVEAQAKQGGSAHGQLSVLFYCAALQNATGGLAGLRVDPRCVQKNVEITSPPKQMLMFSRVQLTDNGTLVFDPWANAPASAPVTFSWADNGGGGGLTRFAVPAAGSGTGILAGTHVGGYGCIVSTTGTLPLGLSANTPYFMHYAGVTNRLNLGTDTKNGVVSPSVGGGCIGNSNAGSGTHTLTPLPFLCWGSGIYVTPGTGLWNYIQASGSVAADDTCRIVPSNTYLRSTRMIPPYNLTLTGGTASALQVYVMNGATGLLEQNTSNTGERGDIGPLTQWASFYMVNQDATSEQNMRVMGHVDSCFSSCVRSVSNGTIINARTDPSHGTYTGINQPPSNDGSQLRWDLGLSPRNIPGAPLVNQQGTFQEIAEEHHPILSYPAYLIFGEPQYYDQVMERANAMPLSRAAADSNPVVYNSFKGVPNNGGSRNFSVLGTDYQGIVIGSDSSRQDAWAIRNVAWAQAIAADSSYDGADYKTYFGDCLNGTFNAINAWRTMYPAGYAVDHGVFGYLTGGRDSEWQSGYRKMATCIAIAACENIAAVTFLNLVAKRTAYVTKIGRDAGSAAPLFNVTGYHSLVCVNTSAGDILPSDFISSDNHMGNSIQTTLTATANVTDVSYTVVAANPGTTYVPNIGDWFIFDGSLGVNRSAPFSLNTPYFVISVTPTTSTKGTVRLSATSGGSAITPTSAMTNIEIQGISLFNAIHTTASSMAADSYTTNMGAWTNWGIALADQGVVIDADFVTDMTNQLAWQATQSGYAASIKNNPKYSMAQSF